MGYIRFRYIIPFVWLICFASCKKNTDNEPLLENTIDKTNVYLNDEFENKLRDSVWYYYKLLSLWEKAIPPKSNQLELLDSVNYLRNNYTQYFQTAGTVLEYLKYSTDYAINGKTSSNRYFPGENPYAFYKQAIKFNNGDSKNFDWYSFLDRGGFISGALSSEGISGFGMDLVYVENKQTNNGDLYVKFVTKNSPAAKAGISRGDRLLSLNGNTNIDYNSNKGDYFNTIRGYFYNSKLNIDYVTADGLTKSTLLEYQNNNYTDVVFADTILNVASKKVGYIGLSSFVNLDATLLVKSTFMSFQNRFNQVIDKFSTANINDLVVDLRYNGGGSVYTSEYLANTFVPSAASGQLMYTNKLNDYLVSLGWTESDEDFAPVYFSKRSNINLPRIYFLVTKETASASELLINVLSPYMEVYIIGNNTQENGKTIANNTYGKPVGFFPLQILRSNIEIYVTSFQMFNKNGYGNYFDGLKPNAHVWEFDSFKDFGNRDESMLASALHHIEKGNFKITASRSVSGTDNQSAVRNDLGTISEKKLEGMYKIPRRTIKLK